MARSLAERLRAHEQQKARLAEQEAKLKTAERKARTRRLIEAGGLVDKVGLLDLDSSTLYGALLSLARRRRRQGAAQQVGGARRAHLRPRGPPARRRQGSHRAHLPGTALDKDATAPCAPPASASTRCCSTGRASPASPTPRCSPGSTAERRAGSRPLPCPTLRRHARPPRRDRYRAFGAAGGVIR